MPSELNIAELLAPVPPLPAGTSPDKLEGFLTVREAQWDALSRRVPNKPATYENVPDPADDQKTITVIKEEEKEPDWNGLIAEAKAMFLEDKVRLPGADASIDCPQVGKHLGPALVLALASLKIEGLPGFSAGLGLVRDFLKSHWEQVHPLPTKGDEPWSRRAKLLRPLSRPLADTEDSWRFYRRVCEAAAVTLENPPRLLTVRDVLAPWAKKLDLALPPAGEAGEVTAETVVTARAEAGERLAENIAVLEAAAQAAEEVEQIFQEQAQPDALASLAELIKLLKNAALALKGEGEFAFAARSSPPEGETQAAGGDAPWGGGAIASRPDALRALAEAANYFRRLEPSSPVPMLIERARRLAGLDFLKLLEELQMAEAAAEFKKLAGLRDGAADEAKA